MTLAGTFTIFQLRFTITITVKKVQRHLRNFFAKVFLLVQAFFVCFADSPPWTLSSFSGSAHNPKARLILQVLPTLLLPVPCRGRHSESSRIFFLLSTDFMSLEPGSKSELNWLSLDGCFFVLLCSVWANDKPPGSL